jgi:hypothetical protein
VDDGRPSIRSAQFRDLIAILVPFTSDRSAHFGGELSEDRAGDNEVAGHQVRAVVDVDRSTGSSVLLEQADDARWGAGSATRQRPPDGTGYGREGVAGAERLSRLIEGL